MKIVNITPRKANSSLIYLKPDTTLLRNNEAFYSPEFSHFITARPALVVKLKKPGKKVAQRFAPRYYEMISAGLSLEASDVLEENCRLHLPWDRAVSFDNSAPLGDFLRATNTFKLTWQKDEKRIRSFTQDDFDIAQSIAEVTAVFTLKIGDLLYICPDEERVQVEAGQVFHLDINGVDLLRCKIN